LSVLFLCTGGPGGRIEADPVLSVLGNRRVREAEGPFACGVAGLPS